MTAMLVGTVVLFIAGHVPVAFAYTSIFQVDPEVNFPAGVFIVSVNSCIRGRIQCGNKLKQGP